MATKNSLGVHDYNHKLVRVPSIAGCARHADDANGDQPLAVEPAPPEQAREEKVSSAPRPAKPSTPSFPRKGPHPCELDQPGATARPISALLCRSVL